MEFPYLLTENKDINTAYRLALSTVTCNTVPYKGSEPVITAGLEYAAPWTRDASINTWNACGLLCSEVTKRTLLGLLDEDGTVGGYAGQNWDNIIWVTGAWSQYIYDGDKEFLKVLYSAAEKTLAKFENELYDGETGLFRGPACYGDGVAAYGDKYAVVGESGIANYPEFNTMKLSSLSTNCLFYAAYVITDLAAEALKLPKKHEEKAANLKESINREFWCDERGIYYYYIDEDGKEEAQEALGNAFAILFGIADGDKAASVAEKQFVSPHGVPCVYPPYKRYSDFGENCFGRHSGTVWPFIQGFWADAVATVGRVDLFDEEFLKETENAVKNCQFYELYHPVTGEPYGGLQEDKGHIREWKSLKFQTWSATGYLRNVFKDIFGMRFSEYGITFAPCGSATVGAAKLGGVKYRGCKLDITLSGKGKDIKEFKINGVPSQPFVSADAVGDLSVEIVLE